MNSKLKILISFLRDSQLIKIGSNQLQMDAYEF